MSEKERSRAYIAALYTILQGLKTEGLVCPKCGGELVAESIRLRCGCRVGGKNDSFA